MYRLQSDYRPTAEFLVIGIWLQFCWLRYFKLKVYHVCVLRQEVDTIEKQQRVRRLLYILCECEMIHIHYFVRRWSETSKDISLTFARSEQPQSGKRPHIADYFFQLTLLLKLCDFGSQLVLLYLYITLTFFILVTKFLITSCFRLFSVIADGIQSGVCRRSTNTWKRAERVIQTFKWAAANTCDITAPRRDSHGIYSPHYYNVLSDINTRTWTARVVPRRPTVCNKVDTPVQSTLESIGPVDIITRRSVL